MKSQTGYKIVFWTFVVLTIMSYLWAIYSIISWIIKAIVS